MNKKRIVAVATAVFMVLTMLPASVFAAETPQGELSGKLAVKGSPAVGSTLSADYTKAEPAGLTDEYVSFVWTKKSSSETEKSQELSKEATYKVKKEDVGSEITLTITGKEDKGVTGTLSVTTGKVTEQPEPTKAVQSEKSQEDGQTAEQQSAPSEEGAGSEDEILVPDDTMNDQMDDSAIEGETGNEGEASGNEETEEPAPLTYSAETHYDNGGLGMDFGEVEAGYSEVEAQSITVKNTGTGDLNFENIAPEHFGITDVGNLAAGEETTVRVWPREGLEPGTYEETISYPSSEGYTLDIPVQLTVTEAKEAAVSLSVDKTAVDFSAEEGYTQIEPVTVTITNNGSEAVKLTLPASQNFLLGGLTPSAEIQPAGTASFTIQPKTGLTAALYTETLKIETEDQKASVEVQATVDIQAAGQKESAFSVAPSEIKFDTVSEGYTESPTVNEVVVENTGLNPLTLVQPESTAHFEVGSLSASVLNPGEKATFLVTAKTGLTEGSYTDTIVVKDADGKAAQAEITASIAVVKSGYSVSVKPESVDFGTAVEGYAPLKEKTVTLVNNGDSDVHLLQPFSDFYILGDLSSTTLAAGKSVTFTIQPETGLSAESYMEEILVENEEEVPISVTANFTVEEDTVSNRLISIQVPADITGLPNGVEKTAEAFGLPEKVTVETSEGSRKASVKWDVKGSNYSQTSTSAQKFKVYGTVTLPEGVTNPDGVNEIISVNVSVKGYTPKVADPAQNKITGINTNEAYLVDNSIQFTAIGAGYDNQNPRNGDVRYVPLNWTVKNTNVWNGAPYQAAFKMSMPGDYTLKVVFNREVYDGSNWVKDGNQDTKSVNFQVVKSKARNITATATPDQKKAKTAVKTGDTTSIMPFVVILIVAVVCVGAVLVVLRKKRK